MKNKRLQHPLSIFIFLHLFMVQNLSAQVPCRQQDSLELVNLYNATNGANWTNKWQLNKPIDTWYGVTLNAQGCVSNIVLRNNNLNGVIPNFNMPNLTTLEIAGNNLGGTIPNFNLPNLTTLDIGFNPLLGTIPNFNMPKLEILSLYYTQVSGIIPNFNMPKLKNLLLYNNKLSGTIPNFNMPELEILSFAQNQLSGTIPNFNLPNLTILNLYKNQLLGTIPNFNLPNLTTLDLSANGLSETMPNFNMPKLENLWLSNNQLSGTIPSFNMPKLKELLLSNNQLSGTIPNFSLPNLTALNMAYNKLSGTIPSFNMPKLKKLLLYVNQLSGTIPHVNMPELEELVLFSNQLSGAIPNFDAPNLKLLYLNNNQLSGCITASLKQYCGKSVDISGNPNLNTQNFAAFCSNGLGMCPAPDLTVSNLSTTTALVSHNQVLNFTFDAKNSSTENATGTFTIKSYLSRDTLLSSDDYQDGVIPTGYGAGVEISQIQGGMLVKPTLAVGYYYLIVKIDGDNEIVELEERNNTTVFKTPILVSSIPEQDIALSMTATPSVYRRYSTHNFKISAKNNGISAFTNVKIKFTRPDFTVSGGTKTASIGTFQDYCVGGIECSEWTIPMLLSGATATLDAPIYILTPKGTLTATASLLSSTPTDNVSANNTTSLLINPSTLPTITPQTATLTAYTPTSALLIVIQKLNPTVTETEITVEIESLMDKTIKLSMANAMGQTVLVQQTAIHKGMNTLRFDVSQLPQGLYFIQTDVGKGRAVPTKFVKF